MAKHLNVSSCDHAWGAYLNPPRLFAFEPKWPGFYYEYPIKLRFDSYDKEEQCKEWLDRNVGANYQVTSMSKEMNNEVRFRLKNEEDVALFKLTWL